MSKYNIIYADPAWSFDNKNTGGSMTSGADAKYPVMTLGELKRTPGWAAWGNEIDSDVQLTGEQHQ